MTQSRAKPETADPIALMKVEEEIAYLAKRHRISAAIVREIIRRTGSSERGAIEREIQKGKARR